MESILRKSIGAKLSGTQLFGADLSGVRLIGADLRFALLDGADLSGADLSLADLNFAQLNVTDISGANLNLAKGLIPLDLERARGDARTQIARIRDGASDQLGPLSPTQSAGLVRSSYDLAPHRSSSWPAGKVLGALFTRITESADGAGSGGCNPPA